MLPTLIPLFHVLFTVVTAASDNTATPKCRTRPGNPSFPTDSQLSQFNSSIEGRLMKVTPSGQFCKNLPGGCSDEQWTNANFRGDIPGSMLQLNWEQDFASNPPSLCVRNSTTCGQGSVPLYGVNATTAGHIQAGVRFAAKHNLRVAVKASGHDFLGRSTAKDSFLLWTRWFQNITFHDSFKVGGKEQGSVVTVGSGVGLHVLYQAAKPHGKILVGGTAETVVAAGGYIQAGGHSALSPKFGLAADNVLEFQVVIADGSLITVNEVSHSDLFWAMRGGGAGSWGIIISATFRTFPSFNAVVHQTTITVNDTVGVAKVATLHAQHIFDWDEHDAGQYFHVSNDVRTGDIFEAPVFTPPKYTWDITTFFPNVSAAASNASIAPFLKSVADAGFVVTDTVTVSIINDAVSGLTDLGAAETVIGSRLIPGDVYRHNATAVGDTYKTLLDEGATAVLGLRIAGGQVSRNAHVNNAVNPKWRTAKAHVVVPAVWDETTPPEKVEAIRQDLTHNKVPHLATLAGGAGSGAYGNEADLREPDFKTTFYGPNYDRLSKIKSIYDPHGLFIVAAGVGSDKWDADGMCKL